MRRLRLRRTNIRARSSSSMRYRRPPRASSGGVSCATAEYLVSAHEKGDRVDRRGQCENRLSNANSDESFSVANVVAASAAHAAMADATQNRHMKRTLCNENKRTGGSPG